MARIAAELEQQAQIQTERVIRGSRVCVCVGDGGMVPKLLVCGKVAEEKEGWNKEELRRRRICESVAERASLGEWVGS